MKPGAEKMIAKVEDEIGWMVFNNPEKRNAVSLEMWEAMPKIIESFEADDSVRVVVMRGAGEKAFVSGADISEFEERRNDPEKVKQYSNVLWRAKRSLTGLRKPLIAMIHGYCLGGGLTLALSADIRIASEDALFGVPAARLGMAYGHESMRELIALVGPARAKEMTFSAERFSAQDALDFGLVNRVAPAEELEASVRALAAKIAANAPLSVRTYKTAITEAQKDEAKRDLEAVQAAVKACFESEDYIEGRRAFMEKRAPRFTGR